MSVKKVVFFNNSPERTALTHLRVLGPLSHTGIRVMNGIEGDKPNLDLIRDGDIIIFQRNFSAEYSNYQAVINEAHKQRKPVVMDLDDYLIGLPRNHPDRLWSPFAFDLPSILHAMIRVDAITVTTPTMKKIVGQYNKNVYVLPNFLDDSIWNIAAKPIPEQQFPVRIAFIGTLTHQPDLNRIAKSLREIADKFKEKVSFLIYGPNVPNLLNGLETVVHRGPSTYDYESFAIDTRSVSADIAIAPLIDNTFNRCKSPIKYLEYTAMGLPCVFSNVIPYADVIKDGFNGFLAEESGEWVEKLSILIENQDLRREMLLNARTDIRSNWMLHDHAHLWQDCFDQILNEGVQTKTEKKAELTALAQISEQIEEQVHKQAEKTAMLHQIVQQQDTEINLLKDTKLREEMHAAELLLAEKDHSENLAKERNIYKEESDRKTSWLEDLTVRNTELEAQLRQVVEETTKQIESLQQERQDLTVRNTELEAQLRQVVEETTKQIESLQQEKQAIHKTKQLLQHEKEVSHSTIQNLQAEIKDLQKTLEISMLENRKSLSTLQDLNQNTKAIQLQNDNKSLQISALEEQNRMLTLELESSKREVVDYVLSDSWRITRPLRKITRLLRKQK